MKSKYLTSIASLLPCLKMKATSLNRALILRNQWLPIAVLALLVFAYLPYQAKAQTQTFVSEGFEGVSFSPGDVTAVVTPTPVDDVDFGEDIEPAIITLTPNTNYQVVSPSQNTVTIADAEVADLNVLIIGSTQDGGNRFGGQSDPFVPTEIATELESILGGAGLGTVNVEVEERYATAYDAFGSSYSYNLSSWYHWPYPAGVETTTRWPNLQGKNGTEWDYVVLIGDPYTMEKLPGHYANGVEMIGQEVAKGKVMDGETVVKESAEVILLMPWPAPGNNESSVAHYKEVVYRAGRTGGYKVAPAALAWEADGSSTGTSHPSARGAYICAATIYSSIWGQSADKSTETYVDPLAELADSVNSTVTSNTGATQYSGSKMDFQNPWLMLGDKRRDVHFSEKGSSTESYYANAASSVFSRAKVSYNDSYRDTYSSNTPQDDGNTIWTNNPMPIAWNHGRDSSNSKAFVVNPDYWQLSFTFDFQLKSKDYSVEDANDYCTARIFSREVAQANTLRSGHSSQRNAAFRLVWAQIHKEYPDERPVTDNAWHVHPVLRNAVPTFMYTMYSGRCPLNSNEALDPGDAGSSIDGYARRMGYETAWRLGTGSARAPGFKVVPSSAAAVSVAPGATDTMSVQFLFEPRDNVTVTVSSSDTSAGIVGPKTLVFTPSNYNVTQTVTIAGVAGSSTSAPFNVVYSTSSDDPAYDGLSDSWAYSCERADTTIAHTDNGTTEYATPKNFAVITNLNASGAGSSNTTLVGAINGTLSWSGSDVIYTPDTDYIGPDGFAYASLSAGSLTTGSIDIDVIDGYPAGSVRAEATDSSAAEEGQAGIFTIIREGDTSSSLAVNFSISGSATNGSDYNLNASSPVNIPAGQGSIDVLLTPVDDTVFGERTETASLTIAAGSGYTEISNPATISIVDNDNTAPTVDAGTAQTVSLLNGSTGPGLYYGTASGNINTTTPNPEILVITDVAAYTGAIAANTTEIFTGQIYDADGSISFTENIDDQSRIWIDGNLVLTSTNYSDRVSTSNLNLTPGWHDIEIRISNGSGGHGDVSSPGIGYDPTGGTAWQTLVDPGDGSFLRVDALDTVVLDLNGTVTDPEDTPATTWTLVSSDPADLTSNFGNVSAIDTTATFIQAGVYTLRLTADDGYGPVSDDVIITVGAAVATYSVTYDANTADSGDVPLDATAYNADDEVTVLGNTGSLVKSGNSFASWNTDLDGGGTAYAAASTFAITDNVTLYAQWSADPSYTLTVSNGTGDGNYAAGVSASITADAPASGYRFVNWTTSDSGSFANVNSASTTYTMPATAAEVTANYALNNLPVVVAGPDQVVTLGSETSWTPEALSTTAWYDASDAATITQSEGAVSQWNDKSDNGNHMLQVSSGNQPTSGSRTINGLNAIDFDGGNEFMQEASNAFGAKISSVTLFVVMQADTNTTYGRILDLSGDGQMTFYERSHYCFEVNGQRYFDGWCEWGNYDGDSGQTIQHSIVYGGPEDLFEAWMSGSLIRSHGSYDANPLQTTGAGMRLAETDGNANYDGLFAEVVIFDSVVDVVTRQKIEGYLAHKWGTAAKLPAGHPYKESVPGAPGVAVNLADASVIDADIGDSPTATWTVFSKDPVAATDPTFDDTSLVNATATFTEAGTYVLHLTANDGHGDPVIDAVTIMVGPPLPVHYATWAGGFTNFTEIEPNANPDGDRMNNLMEFAFGTDPTVQDSASLAIDGSVHGSPIPMNSGGGAFEFYFIRRKDHDTLGSFSYTPQFSSDLNSFTDSAATPDWVLDSSLDATNYEVVKVPYPAGNRFGRVEINITP